MLLNPRGAFCIHESNHLSYLESINKLFEQRRQGEVITLNRKPYRKTHMCTLPDDAVIPVAALCELVLELPEEYETILWMHFVGGKSASDIYRELGAHYVQGIIEYGRRLISKRLGCSDPLDDTSIARILRAL